VGPRSRPTSACAHPSPVDELRDRPAVRAGHAGIAIDGDSERAGDSPIALGVLVGYVAGKPLGIVGAGLLVAWLSRGRLRRTAGWGAVAGAGASAGVAFTVSLLVAARPVDGAQLEKAKAGILAAAWARLPSRGWCSTSSGLLSQRRRIAGLLGGAERRIRGRSRVGPHPRPARRAGDRGRVRRRRAPGRRTGGARSARAAPMTSRTSAARPATCRSQTWSLTPSLRHWPRRPPPIRARSGNARPAARAPGQTADRRSGVRPPTDSGSTWARFTEDAGARCSEPDRPRRGGRGPDRRGRHAPVLHWRAPAPRRVRH